MEEGLNSSHFSVDLTKNAKKLDVQTIMSMILTCFANDYGYEKWVEKSLEFDEGDVLILISASGNSQNMINAAYFAKKIR